MQIPSRKRVHVQHNIVVNSILEIYLRLDIVEWSTNLPSPLSIEILSHTAVPRNKRQPSNDAIEILMATVTFPWRIQK